MNLKILHSFANPFNLLSIFVERNTHKATFYLFSTSCTEFPETHVCFKESLKFQNKLNLE